MSRLMRWQLAIDNGFQNAEFEAYVARRRKEEIWGSGWEWAWSEKEEQADKSICWWMVRCKWLKHKTGIFFFLILISPVVLIWFITATQMR